jgi:dTDP-4-dehydrorhamnose 3,5-epimerase
MKWNYLRKDWTVMNFPLLENFVDDAATHLLVKPAKIVHAHTKIVGVELHELSQGSDDRGELNELLTLRDGHELPIVHVYQVHCAPQSIRAWVYHKHQSDRLAYTQGAFEIILIDLRPDSTSYGVQEKFELGGLRRARLGIPPFVVHGVKNCGDSWASFVNMPTRAYDPLKPDKSRLPYGHSQLPLFD